MAPIAILKELLNETMVRTALVSEDEQMTQPKNTASVSTRIWSSVPRRSAF